MCSDILVVAAALSVSCNSLLCLMHCYMSPNFQTSWTLKLRYNVLEFSFLSQLVEWQLLVCIGQFYLLIFLVCSNNFIYLFIYLIFTVLFLYAIKLFITNNFYCIILCVPCTINLHNREHTFFSFKFLLRLCIVLAGSLFRLEWTEVDQRNSNSMGTSTE